MATRHLTVLALLGSAFVAAAASEAADTPPSGLKLVDGHWTAWEPPTPPEGAKVHVVVSGDTFWSLAAANLGNPYLWPQIWEKNQYVRDAHWIYPGDPLVMDLAVAPAAQIQVAVAPHLTKALSEASAEVERECSTYFQIVRAQRDEVARDVRQFGTARAR